MILDVSIAFFILGAVASLLRTQIDFPKALYQSLTLFLMLAIGLKGGVALSEHASWQLIPQSLSVMTMGIILPLLAFPVLYYIGQLDRKDAASIAAHYGSVSVGTYAVAVAFLESLDISYEAYFPLFVVLLEMPAIAVGILLARTRGMKIDRKAILHEVFCNQGMLLMIGGLVIGFWAGARTATIAPFFFDLFNGVLALFLFEMGMIAAGRLRETKSASTFLLSFGVAMPLIGGFLGCVMGLAIGLSTGGAILLAVLGASASYIAVPAAMRVIFPDANHALAITSSLAITFPFNVLIGIPIYVVFTQWLVT